MNAPKEIDINKINKSHNCIICNYYFLFKINLRLLLKVCDGCQNLMEKKLMLEFLLLKEIIIELSFGKRAKMKP